MPTKRSLKNDVEQLRERTPAEQNGEVSYYKHPDTGDLYDRYKTVVDEPEGIVIRRSWQMAPFVVERETAEAEGWPIVEPVEVSGDVSRYADPVEVSEWCINPWVDNEDDREIVSEE